MATTLTVAALSRASTDLATAAAVDATGNNWTNTGVEFLYVKNGSVGNLTITETFGTGAVIDTVTPTSRTVVIATGVAILLGPWPTQYYNDANGKMNISWSTGTSVTCLLLKTA